MRMGILERERHQQQWAKSGIDQRAVEKKSGEKRTEPTVTFDSGKPLRKKTINNAHSEFGPMGKVSNDKFRNESLGKRGA